MMPLISGKTEIVHIGQVFLICNDLCQGVLNKNHYKLYTIVSEDIQKELRSISSRHWPL